MIKKSEEVVLNLSKSPSFQHNLIPNKRVKKNLKDKLSCSIASKRLITNKSGIDTNQSKNDSDSDININEKSVKIAKKSSVRSITQLEDTPTKNQDQVCNVVKKYETKFISKVDPVNTLDIQKSCESSFNESVIKENSESSEFSEENNYIHKFTNSHASVDFDKADHSKYQDEYNSGDFGSSESDPSFLKESQLSIGNEISPEEFEIDKHL